ncbi:MAG TPA: glycolate oxidase subunit GlcF [Gammaproteobacteria bacterium]|nr:glycolate oxidase subunit GlcF [Gammaproteobacteria bacterium]
MQTSLADFIKQTPQGEEAERILRACVHCGFCLATCPTYQLLGDERDSPRGRIYLMKQVLEGAPATPAIQTHLDRCLTCRACETTCPSGVEYGKLLDIGRAVVEQQAVRPLPQRGQRWLLRQVLPRRHLFAALLGLGQRLRPLLPASLQKKLPPAMVGEAAAWPATPVGSRNMLLLEGCVQPSLAPTINPATARLFADLGIALVRPAEAGCCGAVAQHNGGNVAAANAARRNIDAWWPHIEAGAAAIVINASGCGVQVKEYGHLLRHDPAYAGKAQRVAELAKDPIEILEAEAARLEPAPTAPRRIAFQSPCTLQHGQKLPGRVEALLARLGFTLTPVADPHLCCGSAGTYSLLQPELSRQLQARKIAALEAGVPELIASANIGCLSHLAEVAGVPVRHWIELIQVRGE